MPSRSLTLVVSLGEPVDIEGLPEATGAFGALAGGLHSAPVTITHDGNQHGIQLGLTPAGARALLGCTARDLVSRVVSLEDLLGPRGVELADRVRSAGSWVDRFAAVEDVLGRLVDERSRPRPEVVHAWERLAASDGRCRIGDLADSLGWSRRTLSQRFGDEYGLSPKTAARVMRFERSRALLGTRRTGLAAIAADCGYADQSHLARDWRELAGLSPTAWLVAEVLPLVQDGVGEVVAS